LKITRWFEGACGKSGETKLESLFSPRMFTRRTSPYWGRRFVPKSDWRDHSIIAGLNDETLAESLMICEEKSQALEHAVGEKEPRYQATRRCAGI
jgi:hypothetical protein